MAALRRDETERIHDKKWVIPIAYPFEQTRPGVELFAISGISDRHAWLAGFMFSLPDCPGPAPDPASLADEFGSG
jgi:hypothetical protein